MRKKTWTGFAAAFLSLPLLPMQAFAQQSPEFAYTAEKWATLRDNKLEYEEIAELIHEYNNTVLQNAISYRDEKEDDRDDVAQDYYDRANEIYDSITYPDSDDSSYGSQMIAALNNEIAAEQLMKQGDESTDDAETKKIGYDQTEANLVKQAQGQMISYWSQYYSLDSLRARVTQAQTAYETAQARLSAGMATQADVLSARESVTSAEASLASAETSLETAKQNLCLLFGWSYGADVEIGELPEPDVSRIDSVNLEEDIQTALDTSYSFRLTTKQLANARSSSVKEKLTQTEKNQREAIATSVKDAYSSMVLARSNYEQAQLALELEQTSLAAAQAKLQAGTATQASYQTQLASYQTAEVTVQTQKLALLQAILNYDWAVNGLASAS